MWLEMLIMRWIEFLAKEIAHVANDNQQKVTGGV